MRIVSLYTNKRDAEGNDGKGKKRYFIFILANSCNIIEIDKKSYNDLRFHAIREKFIIEKTQYGNELLTHPKLGKEIFAE